MQFNPAAVGLLHSRAPPKSQPVMPCFLHARIRRRSSGRPIVFAWFMYFAVRPIRCGEEVYFLHFARKTFNPWAGLKTDSRSLRRAK